MNKLHESLQEKIYIQINQTGKEVKLIVMHPNTWRELYDYCFNLGISSITRHEKSLIYMGIPVFRSHDIEEGLFELTGPQIPEGARVRATEGMNVLAGPEGGRQRQLNRTLQQTMQGLGQPPAQALVPPPVPPRQMVPPPVPPREMAPPPVPPRPMVPPPVPPREMAPPPVPPRYPAQEEPIGQEQYQQQMPQQYQQPMMPQQYEQQMPQQYQQYQQPMMPQQYLYGYSMPAPLPAYMPRQSSMRPLNPWVQQSGFGGMGMYGPNTSYIGYNPYQGFNPYGARPRHDQMLSLLAGLRYGLPQMY
jgi:hypothetical protein